MLFVGLCLIALASAATKATTPAPTLSPVPASCGTLFTIGACLQVTNAASFVDCNTTSKKCYCLPTFSGNASPQNRCDCPAPKQVYFPSSPLGGGVLSDSTWIPANWGFGDPICIDLAALQALQADATRQAKHKASVVTFFNNTIYPTPFVILQTGGASLTNILAPNVKSRISPAGAFNGFQGVVEYFYGFVATPNTFVQNVDIREIAATGNTVAAKANILVRNDNAVNGGSIPPPLFNLSIFSFFTFDNNDLITSIDVAVPNLGKLLDVTDPTAQANTILQTCAVLTQPTPLTNYNPRGSCGHLNTFTGGTNQTLQFLNCMDVMYSKPYGGRDRMNADNFVCRNLHMLLTPYGPDLHCPHTSQSGGDSCIEFTYESFFQVEY